MIYLFLLLRLEVSPVNKEAKEDLDKFIQELILQNSSGKNGIFKIPRAFISCILPCHQAILRCCLYRVLSEYLS